MRGTPCYPDATLAPDRERASLDSDTGAVVRQAAARVLRKRGLRTPIVHLAPAALRVLIQKLHRAHRRLGGTRPLPDLAPLTTRPLRQLATDFVRANAYLKGGE